MISEQPILSHYTTDFVTIDRDAVFQAQATIKNAHTATHMRIHNNELLFICIEQSIHIYSLQRIALNQAPLLNVIALSTIFDDFQKQLYEDVVTKIFRNAEKQDFSSQIFSREQDIKSNILLKVQNIKNRINFLNNTKLRVKTFEVNEQGNLFILLQDGRAAFITYEEAKWNGDRYKSVNISQLAKQKITQGCFASSQIVSVIVQGKIVCIDLASTTKLFTHKISIEHISKIYARCLQKDRIKVYVMSSVDVHLLEMNKKKIISYKSISFGDYINNVFFHAQTAHIITQTAIYRLNLNTLEKEVIRELDHPFQMLYIDELQNFTRKSVTNSKQSIWLLDSTTNGVFIGLTIRKQGNYKEGRLLVFEPKLTYFIQRLIVNVKSEQKFINTNDSIFIVKNKENKEILHQFSNLHKNEVLEFNRIKLQSEQYNVVSINMGHIFEGKDSVKQKIIEKVLASRFENLLTNKKLDCSQMLSRCCFTGTSITDQQVRHCKDCDLFGVSSSGDKCVVCYKKMMVYM